MSDVKRWEMLDEPKVCTEGRWVLHSDYAALRARLAEVEERGKVLEQGWKIADDGRIEAEARAEAAETALATARRDALEEAAKVAESDSIPIFKDGWSACQDAAAISTMTSIAAAIRALIAQEEPTT
jgi:hypothetical protein